MNLYGIPAYAVSVAAQIGGESVAGAVVDVAAGITVLAARGHGAPPGRVVRAVPQRLGCAAVTDISGFGGQQFAYDQGRRRARSELVGRLLPTSVTSGGSKAALDLCMVASGRVAYISSTDSIPGTGPRAD